MVLPASTNALWLRKDDLQWFLGFLFDEIGPGGTQGVARVRDDAVQEPPNCKADHVYMEWDFEGIVMAKWVHGPLVGKTLTCHVSTFTEDKWAKMDVVHTYGVAYADASALHIKQAAWHYVEAHCIEVNKSTQQAQS